MIMKRPVQFCKQLKINEQKSLKIVQYTKNSLQEGMHWNCPGTFECQYLSSSLSRIVDHLPHVVVFAQWDHILVYMIIVEIWGIVSAN